MSGVKKCVVCLLTFMGMSVVADACTVPLPQPPMWVLEQGMEGDKDVFLIGVELGPLFEPEEGGTTCACGLNFSSPLPFGVEVDVTDAFVAVTNRNTHVMDVLPEFDFTTNSNTTSALQGRTESFDWFGLATTAINTINQPTLEADEALKLWFRVEVGQSFIDAELGDIAASHIPFDPAVAFSPDNLQFAAGSAESDGTPIFTGEHAMKLFTAVPEPTTLLLAVFAGLGMIGRKRL